MRRSLETECPSRTSNSTPLIGALQETRDFSSGFTTATVRAASVLYDAREWDPRGSGGLEQMIKQGGAFDLDDKIPGFPQIGKFQSDGPVITLPFRWFSRIDTRD